MGGAEEEFCDSFFVGWFDSVEFEFGLDEFEEAAGVGVPLGAFGSPVDHDVFSGIDFFVGAGEDEEFVGEKVAFGDGVGDDAFGEFAEAGDATEEEIEGGINVGVVAFEGELAEVPHGP